jgi:(p)ppGpp synthase/HD superfamily hydrolase
MRIEIQIRTQEMHAQAGVRPAPPTGPIKRAGRRDDPHPWISDLIEILEHAGSAEELLEHTRMAMYQDRIFAFTPRASSIQLPKGATPVDFAYAVHTDLGDQTVGAKSQRPRHAAPHPARQWRPGRDPRLKGSSIAQARVA